MCCRPFFAALSLGFCLAAPASGAAPAVPSVAIRPATHPQIQQTVDRAIVYLQTESAELAENAEMRGLPPCADAPLGVERGRPERLLHR